MRTLRSPIAAALIGIAIILALNAGVISSASASTAPDFRVGVALENPSGLAEFETSVGHKADIFLWYQSISEDLEVATLGPIAQGGRTIQLAWEPWNYGARDLVNQPAYQLRDITAGNWDADIHRWARQVKAFGYPVIFRPMCEMNGDWTSWSGTVNGNVPSDYVPAWRHVHDIFVQEGATNAMFLWSPNVEGDLATATDTFNKYYPGDAYVDYVGMDGYNWGRMYTTPEWTSFWQPFTEVFRYSYDAFTARTSKPQLSLTGKTSYWAGYADFVARKLSVTYTLQNGFGDSAENVQVKGASGTHGVNNVTSLALNLGGISPGGSTDFTLVYSVPAGISRFSAGIQVGAQDEEGAAYIYS